MAGVSTASTSTPRSGEWTVVVRRRHSRKNKNQNLPKPPPADLSSSSPNPLLPPRDPIPWAPSDPSPPSPSSISSLLLKINSSTLALSSSPFFRRLLSHQPSVLSPAVQLVIYGLGSLSSYESPRLQLSLALLLHRELHLLPTIEVFDPVLTSDECTALSHLGCRVLPFDEAGRREISGPTLFYMPHCDAALYHNLLATNWSRARLNQLVVLGNSFAGYAESVEAVGRGSRVGRDAVRYVLLASELAEEVRIDRGLEEDGDRVMFAAFHSTSWHFFHLDDNDDWEKRRKE